MPGTLLDQDRVSSKVKIVAGTHTTVAAVDAVTFDQFTTILAVTLGMKTDPADAFSYVSATWTGNVVSFKSWQNTSGTDPTPVAAGAFAKVLSYVIVGY